MFHSWREPHLTLGIITLRRLSAAQLNADRESTESLSCIASWYRQETENAQACPQSLIAGRNPTHSSSLMISQRTLVAIREAETAGRHKADLHHSSAQQTKTCHHSQPSLHTFLQSEDLQARVIVNVARHGSNQPDIH